MKNITLIKTIIFTLIAMGVLMSIDVVIFQGGFFVSKLSAIPNRGTVLNGELRASAEEKPKANLTIESFSATPKADSDFFRVGEAIDFSCAVKSPSETDVLPFNSTIETVNKNIASGKTSTIQGSFVPENPGVLTVFCRNDATRDRMTLSIYVFNS